jgi:hypothetical protein
MMSTSTSTSPAEAALISWLEEHRTLPKERSANSEKFDGGENAVAKTLKHLRSKDKVGGVAEATARTLDQVGRKYLM